MHGRLKVRTSAEEAARKKKEQELKVKAYRAGMARIAKKRSNNENDDEMLTLTGQILSKNPEVYTLWNIRKKCLLQKQKEGVDEEIQIFFNKDLHFIEHCLMVNPKSYGPWHHRCWIMENCPKPDWENEVMLCSKYLKLDERNFHCWDYRRFVVQKANISPEKELNFCTEKIQKNFSNYSSWHYRSKLLPLLYPHETNKSRPINENILKSELEMVLTAAFTDPNDSSAWFYQRWLLGYSQPALDIAACRISQNFAVLSFTKPLNLSEYEITIKDINGILKSINNDWKSINNKNNVYDTTWISKDKFDLNAIQENLLVVNCKLKVIEDLSSSEQLSYEIKLIKNDIKSDYFGLKFPNFEYEFGSGIIDVLKEQLNSCNELLEYEPDSKWTLLTAALLMRAINSNEYHDKSLTYLKKLEKIDHLRKGYYEDLASKWTVEKGIKDWIENTKEFPYKISTLKDNNLTTICYEQYLCITDEIDLSNNLLTSRILPKFKHFQFCQELNLNNNKFTDLKNFPNITMKISLTGNNIYMGNEEIKRKTKLEEIECDMNELKL